MLRDLDYVQDMLEAAHKIQAFAEGLNLEQFARDERTRLAVIRLLEVIGEAANRLSAAFRATHPEIPWRDTIDMRNRLIHDYRSVRPEIVWKTTTGNIPALIAQLEPLLPPEEDEDPEAAR